MADENKPMSSVARVAIQLGTGALAGLVGSSVGGPKLISLWYAPPSGDAFSCAGSVQNALSQFVTMQLVCAAAGGVLVTIGFFLARRALAERKTARATAAP